MIVNTAAFVTGTVAALAQSIESRGKRQSGRYFSYFVTHRKRYFPAINNRRWRERRVRPSNLGTDTRP